MFKQSVFALALITVMAGCASAPQSADRQSIAQAHAPEWFSALPQWEHSFGLDARKGVRSDERALTATIAASAGAEGELVADEMVVVGETHSPDYIIVYRAYEK